MYGWSREELGSLVRFLAFRANIKLCFLYLAVFGQWDSAMVTLASIVIAVPFGVAGGLLAGIAAYRRRWVENLIRPLLDLMQTVPVFAYLIPVLLSDSSTAAVRLRPGGGDDRHHHRREARLGTP